MPRVVITGATSMIGTHLCKEFRNRGWEVYGIHRNQTQRLPDGVHSVCMGLSQYHTLSKVLPLSDVGVMLAWNGTRGQQRIDHALQHKNYECSMDCLRELIQIGCHTIVTAGSQAEYGPQLSEEKVTEETIPQPDTAYGIEKKHLFEDSLRLCEAKNVRLLEPRFYSVYGPGDYEGSLVMQTLHKMLRNEKCEFTECRHLWDFLYAEDAAALLADLVSSGAASGAYNFGSGDVRQLKDYVLEMKSTLHSQSELDFGAISYIENKVIHLNPDIAKLISAVGRRQFTSFKQGIQNLSESIRIAEI